MVGGLLDLQLAVGVALDHDDALDLDRAAVLDRFERLVGLHAVAVSAKSATIRV